MSDKFTVYKGLQSPLCFKGFKGRYIFWGAGFIVSSIVLGVITMTFLGTLIGLVLIIVILGGGLFYTYKKQSVSLYDIRNDNDIIFYVNKKKVFKNEKK